MSMPIRLIIGFLPGIETKDARAFAQGYIERHMQAIDVASWYVQRYKDGTLYEIHEGGEGRAYLPSILKLLESTPKVLIPISGRMVSVEKGADDQISSLLMPESFVGEATEGVKPGPRMHPALGDARGWIFTGGTFFAIGLLFFLLGTAIHLGARYVYELGVSQAEVGDVGKILAMAKGEYPSQAARDVMPLSDTPVAQWPKLINSTDPRVVKALRYEKDTWRLEYEESEALPEVPNDAGEQVPDAEVSAAPVPQPPAVRRGPGRPPEATGGAQ